MKNPKKIVFTTLLILFLFIFQIVFLASSVSAQELWDSQVGMRGADSIGDAFGTTSGEPKRDIRVMIASIINTFLGFLGIVFVLLFIWAGWKYMTSQGNEETIGKAKAQMTSAFIGLAIILLAYSVSVFITDCMYEITTSPGGVWLCR